MKVLSLWQPWATLIAAGHKTIETRGWRTPYTGPVAIHAAKRWTAEEQGLQGEEPFRSALIDATDRGLWSPERPPLGCVVAVAYLVGCYPILPRSAGVKRYSTKAGPLMLPPVQPERDFGNYAPARWAWLLRDVRPVVPIPLKGAQGLFEWDGVPAPTPHVVDEAARTTRCICGAHPSATCTHCGRGACVKHARLTATEVVCLACVARQTLARTVCHICGCWPETNPLRADCSCSCHHHRTTRHQPMSVATRVANGQPATPTLTTRSCPECSGRGWAVGVACTWCGGTGRYTPPIDVK